MNELFIDWGIRVAGDLRPEARQVHLAMRRIEAAERATAQASVKRAYLWDLEAIAHIARVKAERK